MAGQGDSPMDDRIVVWTKRDAHHVGDRVLAQAYGRIVAVELQERFSRSHIGGPDGWNAVERPGDLGDLGEEDVQAFAPLSKSPPSWRQNVVTQAVQELSQREGTKLAGYTAAGVRRLLSAITDIHTQRKVWTRGGEPGEVIAAKVFDQPEVLMLLERIPYERSDAVQLWRAKNLDDELWAFAKFEGYWPFTDMPSEWWHELGPDIVLSELDERDSVVHRDGSYGCTYKFDLESPVDMEERGSAAMMVVELDATARELRDRAEAVAGNPSDTRFLKNQADLLQQASAAIRRKIDGDDDQEQRVTAKVEDGRFIVQYDINEDSELFAGLYGDVDWASRVEGEGGTHCFEVDVTKMRAALVGNAVDERDQEWSSALRSRLDLSVGTPEDLTVTDVDRVQPRESADEEDADGPGPEDPERDETEPPLRRMNLSRMMMTPAQRQAADVFDEKSEALYHRLAALAQGVGHELLMSLDLSSPCPKCGSEPDDFRRVYESTLWKLGYVEPANVMLRTCVRCGYYTLERPADSE